MWTAAFLPRRLKPGRVTVEHRLVLFLMSSTLKQPLGPNPVAPPGIYRGRSGYGGKETQRSCEGQRSSEVQSSDDYSKGFEAACGSEDFSAVKAFGLFTSTQTAKDPSQTVVQAIQATLARSACA
jgi:hypothetical protein